MGLVLEIENAAEVSSGVRSRVTVNDRPLTIGRSAEADWRLHDPTRLVSSVHCSIEPTAGGYVLTDRSRNGTTVDGAPVERAGALLRPGAELRIGPYRIRVEETDDPSANVVNADRTVIAGVANGAVGEAPTPTVPSASTVPSQFRSPLGTDAALANIDALGWIEDAATLSPDALAGRSAEETVRDLVRAFAIALPALESAEARLRAMLREGDDHASSPLADMLTAGANVEGRTEALALRVEDRLAALDHVLPLALFRLLNRLAPPTLENSVRGGPGADGRAWRLYRERWEAMAMGSENGMLDIFTEELRAALAERLADA